jgi:hypothetical protein
MGAFTTLRITRIKAKQKILELLESDVSDGQLKEILDRLLEHRLYNAIIVSDFGQNDDGDI